LIIFDFRMDLLAGTHPSMEEEALPSDLLEYIRTAQLLTMPTSSVDIRKLQ